MKMTVNPNRISGQIFVPSPTQHARARLQHHVRCLWQDWDSEQGLPTATHVPEPFGRDEVREM